LDKLKLDFVLCCIWIVIILMLRLKLFTVLVFCIISLSCKGKPGMNRCLPFLKKKGSCLNVNNSLISMFMLMRGLKICHSLLELFNCSRGSNWELIWYVFWKNMILWIEDCIKFSFFLCLKFFLTLYYCFSERSVSLMSKFTWKKANHIYRTITTSK
jgi:hypothetical protein